jgi:hypothetical protein
MDRSYLHFDNGRSRTRNLQRQDVADRPASSLDVKDLVLRMSHAPDRLSARGLIADPNIVLLHHHFPLHHVDRRANRLRYRGLLVRPKLRQASRCDGRRAATHRKLSVVRKLHRRRQPSSCRSCRSRLRRRGRAADVCYEHHFRHGWLAGTGTSRYWSRSLRESLCSLMGCFDDFRPLLTYLPQLHLTPRESERLRQVSYDRQVEAGFKNPGHAGLVARHSDVGAIGLSNMKVRMDSEPSSD